MMTALQCSLNSYLNASSRRLVLNRSGLRASYLLTNVRWSTSITTGRTYFAEQSRVLADTTHFSTAFDGDLRAPQFDRADFATNTAARHVTAPRTSRIYAN